MRFSKTAVIRILCFVLMFVIINSICSFLLLKVDGTTFLTIYDYENEDDIDVLFVGNSLCRCAINPYIIDQKMNVNSFNLSKESAKLEGIYQLLKTELPKKRVKNIVIVIDPYQIFEPEEETIVLAALYPYIDNPIDKCYYSTNSSIKFGSVMDRFFPWRMFYEESPSLLINNISYKFDKDKCYSDKLTQYNNLEGRTYGGKGYGNHNMPVDNKSIFRAIYEHDHVALDDNSVSELTNNLSKIKSLCDKYSCSLIAITTPLIKQIVVNDKDYKDAFEMVQSSCDQLNIEYFNFALLKEDYLSDSLEPYFYDGKSHLNGGGADIFSDFLAAFLQEYYSGNDISSYFYSSKEYFS